MTDQGKASDLNEAAARFAETLADSYRLVYDQAAESGERQRRYAQEFSDLVTTNLKEQAEHNSSPSRRVGSGKPDKSSRGSLSKPTRSSLMTPSPATGPVPSRS